MSFWNWVGLAAIAVVAAILANLVSDWLGEKLDVKSRSAAWIAFLFIGAIAIGVYLLSPSGANDAGSSRPSPEPQITNGTATANVESSTFASAVPIEQPAAGTPSSPAEPSTPVVMATSLLDLTSVQQDTNSEIDLRTKESIEIDGTTYGRALTYSCSLYCDGSSPQTLEVSLGKQFASFKTTFVVLNTATGSHRLDITLDGAAPQSFATEPGQPQQIELDVRGVSRMRIQMYSPGPLKSPIEAGADMAGGQAGGGLPGSALGDPILLP